MHMSAGLPLISAEHEPHLPALQFQRQARSGAWVAWTRWITSRTTSPSTAGSTYSVNSPPAASPRHRTMVTSSSSSDATTSCWGAAGEPAGSTVDETASVWSPVVSSGAAVPVISSSAIGSSVISEPPPAP